MIETIQLHLHDDETQQVSNETALSEKMHQNYMRNLAAFKFHMPAVADALQREKSKNISVFCNKYGEGNVVDYGLGRVLYGLHPKAEIKAQFDAFCTAPLCFPVKKKGGSLANTPSLASAPLRPFIAAGAPQKIPVMVVTGIGMGYHIHHLVEQFDIDHLIIYEPEFQLFQCSVLAAKWHKILNLAASKNTTIYLQLDNDGNSLKADLNELAQAVSFAQVYVYRHYNTPVFNYLLFDIALNGLQQDHEQSRHGVPLSQQYVPAWTGAYAPTKWKAAKLSSRVEDNLQAFKKYIPDIYNQFKDYCPQEWFPVSQDGKINVVNWKLLIPWYSGNPKDISNIQFEGFCKHPRKDGIVLGYEGEKLKHYLHYQFVAESQTVLDDVHEMQQSLPDNVKSLIVFGLGCGYDLTALTEQRNIENLFICEPNRDFFYASLYAIDWAGILADIDAQGGRIYLNVGDDGTHLFTDLLNQFHSIGPYVLAQTYFYQSYFDDRLNGAIAQLREQLQVVIAMGEYFDHAYFGISHTLESIRREHRFLTQSADNGLKGQLTETPVFLVGNGPSLDEAIETIREYQDRAIIISCGTAIQVLNRHGILPDFHAEIEQNRATYDWAKSVYDDEYLKQIDILSCNGLHPDTSDVYRNTYLAFKEGESSTLSTLAALNAEEYQRLKYAFPTVSNFAANVVLAWGCQQIYLFGVDLGFKDVKKHHSEHSGYYTENGEEIYDYSESNNVSLRVPGNFSPAVNTKYEFKVAATSLEQALADYRPECYNTADGARIKGADPLPLDMILLTNDAEQKQKTLAVIRTQLYQKIPAPLFFERYQKTFSEQAFARALDEMSDSIAVAFTSAKQVDRLIEEQKMLLFNTYSAGDCLLFYYFYGSMNYYHATLSKILGAGLDDDTTTSLCEKVREKWGTYFSLMKRQLQLPELAFDVSKAMSQRRFYTCLAANLANTRLSVVTDSKRFKQGINQFISDNRLAIDVDFYSPSTLASLPTEGQPFVAIALTSTAIEDWRKVLAHFPYKVTALVSSPDPALLQSIDEHNCMTIWLAGNSLQENTAPLQSHDYFRASLVINYFSQVDGFEFILPKVKVSELCTAPYPFPSWLQRKYPYIYDTHFTVALTSTMMRNNNLLMPNGHRAAYLQDNLDWTLLTTDLYTHDELETYRQKQLAVRPYLMDLD